MRCPPQAFSAGVSERAPQLVQAASLLSILESAADQGRDVEVSFEEPARGKSAAPRNLNDKLNTLFSDPYMLDDD